MYDTIILGSGPAGLTAAIYTGRAKKSTLVLAGASLGGQTGEIAKLEKAVSQEGLTIVPIKAYFEGSYLKITIAEAKGKKTYDKRESIKQKDIDRKLSREQF